MSMNGKGIFLLGLGPGDPSLLTHQASTLLSSISEVYVRTSLHPALQEYSKGLQVISFDDLINGKDDITSVFDKIVTLILELARNPDGVVYAVPGHPIIDNATSSEIFHRAKEVGIPVKVIEGISLVGYTLAMLGKTGDPHLSVIDALEFSKNYFPTSSPRTPAIIPQVYSQKVLDNVKRVLLTLYPIDHPIQLVHAGGTPDGFIETLPLEHLDKSGNIEWSTTLYVPPLGEYTSFEEFQELIAHLRSPEGCPWDREQTHQSLRRNLVEETYEVLHAIDLEDSAKIQEELGDLLLQITLHAQIAAENKEFTMSNILEEIYTKLVRRHPHVFGDVDLGDAQSVIVNWERIKAIEREENYQETGGMFDGIPAGMPALSLADAYQRRAASVGFDWPEIGGVIKKIKEELKEYQRAEGKMAQAEEIGDILFAVANLARWLGIDPESALRETNSKFKKRFAAIEVAAQKQGKKLSDMTLDEMDEIWEQSKGDV